MAEPITSDNFDKYFLQSLALHGKSEETAPDANVQSLTSASLPLIQTDPTTGVRTYVKITVSSLIDAIAGLVSSEGLLEAITEAEFDAIFD